MELVFFIIKDPVTFIADTYIKTCCCSLSIKMLLKIYFALTEISIWFIFNIFKGSLGSTLDDVARFS